MTVAHLSGATTRFRADSFEDVCRANRTRLIALLERTYGHADAEDIAQEALTRYYANPPVDAGWRDPWPWLAVVARNLGHDLYRRRVRLCGLNEDTVEQLAPTRDVLDEILAGETAAEVEDAMSLLSPQQRLILRMREIEGRSFGEIAEHIGSNENAVRQQLFRARRRAAAILEPSARSFGVAAFGALVRRWLRPLRRTSAATGAPATAAFGAAGLVAAVGTAATMAGVLGLARPAPVRVMRPASVESVSESALPQAAVRRAPVRVATPSRATATAQTAAKAPAPPVPDLAVQQGPMNAAVDVDPKDPAGKHDERVGLALPGGKTLWLHNYDEDGNGPNLCDQVVIVCS
jgi:RNA polymerase sigma-70 factor (ECF subfamily)